MPSPSRNVSALDPMIVGSEDAVLSYLLSGEPRALDKIGQVSPDDFLSPTKRQIFIAICDVASAGREPNPFTLTQQLLTCRRLEQVGGAAEVTRISLQYSSENVFDYSLGLLRDAACPRRVTEVCEQWRKGTVTIDELMVRLTEITEPRRGEFPAIIDVSELIARETELPPDIVEGLFHRGGKLAFGGGSKSFKTFTLINLAASVATGADFLGRRTTKGRVLYINLEIPSSYFAHRTATICKARATKVEFLKGNLDVWNLRGYAADFSRLLSWLLARIRHDDYYLIILDPIYKCLGDRDENKAGDIATLLNAVEQLAVHSGAGVAFGAHFSKGNQAQKESIDRIGGSGVFARDPDSILTFTKHQVADCFTVECVLRNHAPVKPFVVKWEYPLMRIEDSLDPQRLKQAKKGGGASVADIIELLEKPMSTVEWATAAREEIGLSNTTFYRLLREAKPSGKILRSNRKWQKK
jgi:hypothetical protein